MVYLSQFYVGVSAPMVKVKTLSYKYFHSLCTKENYEKLKQTIKQSAITQVALIIIENNKSKVSNII